MRAEAWNSCLPPRPGLRSRPGPLPTIDRNRIAGALLQPRQRLFDVGEIRQFLRRRSLLAVLDDAAFVDDEGGTRGSVSYAGQHRKDDTIVRSEEHTSELQSL